MRIALSILLCFLFTVSFAQSKRIDTSLNFSIKKIYVTKQHKLDTTEFNGQVVIQINEDTSLCVYSHSTLTIDKNIWKALRGDENSKVDSAFLLIQENNETSSFIKIPYRPANTDCPCLLEVKTFFDQPDTFNCAFWSRLGYMGTVYFVKGERITNLIR